jgi:hypothetical protein
MEVGMDFDALAARCVIVGIQGLVPTADELEPSAEASAVSSSSSATSKAHSSSPSSPAP